MATGEARAVRGEALRQGGVMDGERYTSRLKRRCGVQDESGGDLRELAGYDLLKPGVRVSWRTEVHRHRTGQDQAGENQRQRFDHV